MFCGFAMKTTQALRLELCAALNSPNFNEHDFNCLFKLEYLYAYRRKSLFMSDFDVELVWYSNEEKLIFQCWHRYSDVSFLLQFIEVAQKAGFDLDVAAAEVMNQSVYIVQTDPVCVKARARHEELCKQVRQDNTQFRLCGMHMFSFHNGQSCEPDEPDKPRRMHVCLEWAMPGGTNEVRFLCWHSWDKVCHIPAVAACANKMGFDAARVAREVPNDSVYTVASAPYCVPAIIPDNHCVVGGSRDAIPENEQKMMC